MAKKVSVKRGHPGRGKQGACGKGRKRDGSGGGIGNFKKRAKETKK